MTGSALLFIKNIFRDLATRRHVMAGANASYMNYDPSIVEIKSKVSNEHLK